MRCAYCIVLMKWKARLHLPAEGNFLGMNWLRNSKLIRKWLLTWTDHVFEGRKMQTKKQTWVWLSCTHSTNKLWILFKEKSCLLTASLITWYYTSFLLSFLSKMLHKMLRILRFEGNNMHCSPRDQSLSYLLYSKTKQKQNLKTALGFQPSRATAVNSELLTG